MNNDAVYAQGLLKKALDPSSQPPAIQSFLQEDVSILRRLLPQGSRVVDFGCGTGRHLLAFENHLAYGVGFDYEPAYIAEASVPARSEWYANMGHEVLRVTDREIVADGGFTSEHFTETRLRELLGPCELHAIGDIAFVAQC